MLFNEELVTLFGVMTSRLNVPFVEFSYIDPGLSTKQLRPLAHLTSRAKHFARLFKINKFGTIGSAANCCVSTLSTLTFSDGGFNG